MAYTPINWQTGDVITAEKLNKMDNGWGIASAQLFSETVTTNTAPFGGVSPLAYSDKIDSDTITVTFDGTVYTCTKTAGETGNLYGAATATPPDFTDYPFGIKSGDSGNMLFTQTAGEHTISVVGSAIETSGEFRSAVGSFISSPLLCVSGVTTAEEMVSAYSEGRLLYCHALTLNTFFIVSFSAEDESVSFIPSNEAVTMAFVDGVFTVTDL